MSSDVPVSDFPVMRYVAPVQKETDLPPGATSLDLLRQVYRDANQLLSVRMRAAQVAIAYEHPKLAVSANISIGGQMERMMQERGGSMVIDGRAERQVADSAEVIRKGPTVEPAEGTSNEP